MINTEYFSGSIILFRFYNTQEAADSRKEFCGICVFCIEPEDNTSGWIKGMHGIITKQHIINMAKWMHTNGFKTAYAERLNNKRLPGFVPYGEHQMTKIEWWIDRFNFNDSK